jgi:Pectate lyase superfamily protein
MNELLSRDLAEAKRRIAARRLGFDAPSSLDAFFLERAAHRTRTQPHDDYTINELPLIALPQSTDLVPVWHNGQTYQAPAGAIAALANANSATSLGIVNVKAPPFNAAGNGITDDTSAIQAAINYAQSSGNGLPGLVWFPAGTYLYSALVVGPQPIKLMGVGTQSTVLSCTSPTATGITFTGANNNLTSWMIESLSMHDTITRTGGMALSFSNPTASNTNWIVIRDVFILAPYSGIQFSLCNHITLDNVSIAFIGANGFGLKITGGPSTIGRMSFRDMLVDGPDTSTSIGIDIDSIYDLLWMTDSQFESCGTGLSIAPLVAQNTGTCDSWFTNVLFDNTVETALSISPGNGVQVSRFMFRSCWFAGQNNAAQIILGNSGTGSVTDVTFSDCPLISNGSQPAVQIYANATGWKFQNCGFNDIAGQGISVLANAGKGVITGNRMGALYSSVNSSIGIALAGGNSDILVDANDVSQCGSGASLTNPSTYSNVVFRGNLGFNPVGTGTPPAIAATTVAVSNPLPVDANVIVYIGSAPSVTTKITYPNATQRVFTAFTAGNVSYLVPAGATIALTYASGAPTWDWTWN